MKKAFVVTEALIIAILTFLTAVVVEKESDGAIAKYIGYADINISKPCIVEKKYPKIITGVDYER